MRHSRSGGRGGGARCHRGGPRQCRGAAFARLRLLRSLCQFRGARRSLPQGCRESFGYIQVWRRRGAMLIGRTDRGLLASWWFTVDRLLLTAVLLLMAAGVLISMAASPPVAERLGYDSFHFFNNQLLYLGPAVVVLVALSFATPAQVRRLSMLVFLGSLGLMVAALHFGPEIKGAHRWIEFGPVNLQPSEFAKPAFIVVAAWLLAENTRRPDMPGHILAFLLAIAFIGLLVIQPDFGQTVLMVLVFCAMLLIYGIPWIVIFGLAGAGMVGLGLAYETLPHVAS